MRTVVIAPESADRDRPVVSGQEPLGGVLLHRNATWFVRIRWAVVGVLAAGALLMRLFGTPLSKLGFADRTADLALIASLLAAANGFFCIAVRRLTPDSRPTTISGNLWLQIVTDLFFVTWLVHVVGSTETFISFTYLFHVVLACIFFPPRHSLLVTALASILYGGCITAEFAGIIPPGGMLPQDAHVSTSRVVSSLFATSAIFIWGVVWYLTSSLSQAVRRRDADLATANEQLVQAEQERNAIMLRTVHDLKAPFAGIESNIEVLRAKFWNDLQPEVQDLVGRINRRSESLRARIRDILQLGDLRASRDRSDEAPVPCDIATVLDGAKDETQERANALGITIHMEVPPLQVVSVPAKLHVLFANLMTNAVVYSRQGGKVEVSGRQKGDHVLVTIADHGIGIAEDALPRIFDEYYRSSDAAGHNPHSTGLGMSIVKEVSRQLRLRVAVASEKGKGTTVEVCIPIDAQTSGRGCAGERATA